MCTLATRINIHMTQASEVVVKEGPWSPPAATAASSAGNHGDCILCVNFAIVFGVCVRERESYQKKPQKHLNLK